MTEPRDFDLDPDMLSGYLDDELDDPERAAVEARLAESAEWRAELDDVRTARSAVRGLPSREAPPGFWDAVLATVAAADSGPVAVAEMVAAAPAAPPIDLATRRARQRRAWIVGAAAAVVALVTAVVVVPHRAEVAPNVTAVITRHGAQSADAGDPISTLAPVGPFAGFRR
jgi:negative regulator of sigma E activity